MIRGPWAGTLARQSFELGPLERPEKSRPSAQCACRMHQRTLEMGIVTLSLHCSALATTPGVRASRLLMPLVKTDDWALTVSLIMRTRLPRCRRLWVVGASDQHGI